VKDFGRSPAQCPNFHRELATDIATDNRPPCAISASFRRMAAGEPGFSRGQILADQAGFISARIAAAEFISRARLLDSPAPAWKVRECDAGGPLIACRSKGREKPWFGPDRAFLPAYLASTSESEANRSPGVSLPAMRRVGLFAQIAHRRGNGASPSTRPSARAATIDGPSNCGRQTRPAIAPAWPSTGNSGSFSD